MSDSRQLGLKTPDASAYGTLRNLFLDAIFKEVQASVAKRDALSGVGFSGWSGEGRVSWRAGALPIWHPGDKLLADSRSDPQGLYSVYDKDASTINLIRSYAERWSQPSQPKPDGRRQQ